MTWLDQFGARIQVCLTNAVRFSKKLIPAEQLDMTNHRFRRLGIPNRDGFQIRKVIHHLADQFDMIQVLNKNDGRARVMTLVLKLLWSIARIDT